MIKVYGRSDDLIEVVGESLDDEFYGGEEKKYLCFSDGTALEVWYSDSGIWRIGVISKGASFISKDECVEETRERYSDHIFLGEDVKWVIAGNEMVRAKPKKG